MSLFGHGNPEEFLLFIRNFQITLVATGTLETEVKNSIFVRLSIESMKNFFHKKGWGTDTNPAHEEPPTTIFC